MIQTTDKPATPAELLKALQVIHDLVSTTEIEAFTDQNGVLIPKEDVKKYLQTYLNP